jgi:ribosomal protein S17E
MGKAVPRKIKLISSRLLEKFPDKFKEKEFVENKRFIDSLKMPIDKKTRNLVAGFITRTLSAKDLQ